MSLTHPRSSLSSSITPCLKVRYQRGEQESPSFSTDGALCLWRRNRKTDRRGKYQKYCLHLASFQNVDSCKTDVVNLILLFSFTVCKRTALGFSLFKAKYNNSFNGKHWLWVSIKTEACHKCEFLEMNGAIHRLSSRNAKGRGETSPRITAVITYLLHGHACHFRVESFPWRHNGWKTQITWKCVSERFWNCSLWFFYVFCSFYFFSQ